MAFSLNKIMLIGNLGKDAETRFTTTNLAVTNFTLATTNSYKGKDGNWQNETTWHNVVAFSLSDYMKNQLRKGKKFYVEGRLTKRDYTDKDGNKRYTVEVAAEKIIPLESSSEQGSMRDDITGHSEIAEADISVEENDDLPF
jgi:single-strand DNA-binding protein